MGAPADQLEAVDGRIQVKGNPSKSLTWKAACQKLGVNKISEMGENNQRNPGGLNSARRRRRADGRRFRGYRDRHRQDEQSSSRCRTAGWSSIPRLAESQVYGAMHHGHLRARCSKSASWTEQTGRMLNPDMEFYKLAGIGDIGEIVVHWTSRRNTTSAA